mmetsp:Transcript_32076/g.69272  ORF Transcript_32076/g.69272 Transcript_32076/m.69272 type:complete len:251 (+) Transcript_32076:123-875(+)
MSRLRRGCVRGRWKWIRSTLRRRPISPASTCITSKIWTRQRHCSRPHWGWRTGQRATTPARPLLHPPRRGRAIPQHHHGPRHNIRQLNPPSRNPGSIFGCFQRLIQTSDKDPPRFDRFASTCSAGMQNCCIDVSGIFKRNSCTRKASSKTPTTLARLWHWPRCTCSFSENCLKPRTSLSGPSPSHRTIPERWFIWQLTTFSSKMTLKLRRTCSDMLSVRTRPSSATTCSRHTFVAVDLETLSAAFCVRRT